MQDTSAEGPLLLSACIVAKCASDVARSANVELKPRLTKAGSSLDYYSVRACELSCGGAYLVVLCCMTCCNQCSLEPNTQELCSLRRSVNALDGSEGCGYAWKMDNLESICKNFARILNMPSEALRCTLLTLLQPFAAHFRSSTLVNFFTALGQPVSWVAAYEGQCIIKHRGQQGLLHIVVTGLSEDITCCHPHPRTHTGCGPNPARVCC